MRLLPPPKYVPLLATALVLGGLFVAGAFRYENFGTLGNVLGTIRGQAMLGVVAIGATFVILSGGIDLSVGAVVALTGMIVAAALPSGVQVVVPEDNPVRQITRDQLRQVYAGEITNLKQLGGPDRAIVPVTRELASSAHDSFMKHVMAGRPLADRVQYVNDDSEVKARVQGEAGAIGYVDLYYAPRGLGRLMIDGEHGVQVGLNPALAIAMALAAGLAIGAGMGCLIHFFELPAFLVTLAGMFFARGAGFVIHTRSIPIKHPFFLRTVNEDLVIPLGGHLEIPLAVIVLLALLAAALVLAHWTRFGRNVYAIGGSENSARLMGLGVGRTKILIYTLAGLCSAIGGVVWTFELQSGDPLQAGLGMELDAIAAVVIGGTLLSGGVGFVAGTLMGVLILGLIKAIITFENINSWWTKIIMGMLLLAFILLQNFVTKASMRRKKT